MPTASGRSPSQPRAARPPATIPRRALLRLAGATAGGLALSAAGTHSAAPAAPLPPPTATADFSAEVATDWFALALALVQTTPGFSPPVAARAFGYAGLTLYEAVVAGMPQHQSLASQLTDLGALPGPPTPARHWPTVANAALAAIFRGLFATTTDQNTAALAALEERFAQQFRVVTPPGIFRRSVEFGQAVAHHIFAWSTTDGGHAGYLTNFPTSYTPPVGPGLWVPTAPAFARALQPYWGANRPFALAAGQDCAPDPPTAYSEEPGSACYAEAREVYETASALPPEQAAIARFWSDDPGATATPSGHWIAILTQVIRARGAALDVAAEAYAKVGMVVADAFIICWSTKYRYNVLRPITYIQALIDPRWTPLLVTPPFPEYTSGHSVQSAAAAHVLTDLFGPMPFTDDTHAARGLPPRSFSSFVAAAAEAAISRLYGGIHFRPAIERGLEQGVCLGRQIDALRFRR
jgi:hypothetical protein